MFLDFHEPLLDVRERHRICDIVNNQNTHSISVMGRCDGLEPLLARGIQELYLNFFVIKLNSTKLKIDSDGWCLIHI